MTDESGSRRGETWLQRLGFDKERTATLSTLLHDLDELQEQELLDEDSVQMIKAIVESTDLTVRDIMVPRAKMVMIEIDAPFDESLAKIIESGHSRFPVLTDNHEEIMGILISKDLLPYVGEKDIDIHSLIRPVDYVPEGKDVISLINDLRMKRSHLALVVDEYGSVSGLITIEDLIEQIVGRIDDEHDIATEEPKIKKVGEHKYIVNALITLEDFNEAFSVDLDVEDVETISGLLMRESGTLPQEGEVIQVGRFDFTVLPYHGNFIESVELVYKDAQRSPQGDGA